MNSKWTSKETMLFLKLYLKYKCDFDGHLTSNANMWNRVADELQDHGFSTSYVKLDRKWRNMKRTYTNIKRKNLDKTPNWPYFTIMEKICGGNSHYQAIDLKSSEGEETVYEPKIELLSESYPPLDEELLDEYNFEDIISDRITTEEQDVDVDSPFMNLAEELEVQRLEELRVIRQTLQESNIIQRERNQILEERNVLMRQYLTTRLKSNKHV